MFDTNVFISGVFFGRLPARILGAWRDARLQPVWSTEILEEYQRVGRILAGRASSAGNGSRSTPGYRGAPFASARLRRSDDDKFLACALAAGVRVIVSGDKDLVDQSGWYGIRVLRPRQFVDELLS